MKNLDNFMKELKRQFEDSDSKILTPNTKFNKLNTFDSLTRYSIIAFVNDNYSIQLQDDIFEEVITPLHLFNKIHNEK
jgi:acyl carrier protein